MPRKKQEIASGRQSTPAVFLDRDGTLIVDVDFLNSIERLELIPGAAEAVRIFNRLGKKVIVVSNQSGIARGYFNEEQVEEIHRAMRRLFAAEGARIDAIYYCPHHPDFGEPQYRRNCNCRKPEPGLFLQAAAEHQIDLEKSYMIGDKYSDVEAGKRLNMVSILVLTGNGKHHYELYKDKPNVTQPDFVAADVLEAAQYILRRETGGKKRDE